MTLTIHRKITIASISIFMVIVMFDAVFELFVALLHVFFELFEYSLEFLIEHVFHTNHHQSEVILINLLLIMALLGLFWLWRIIPRFKTRLISSCLIQKERVSFYWQTLTPFEKIKTVTAYTMGLGGILFLLFI